MNKRDTKTNACFCEGYHFKHRMGSLYCWKRKDGTERFVGDEDFWDRNMSQEEHDALVESKKLELEESCLQIAHVMATPPPQNLCSL
jgi:hypothetical protein